jgi:hypothetical protein
VKISQQKGKTDIDNPHRTSDLLAKISKKNKNKNRKTVLFFTS